MSGRRGEEKTPPLIRRVFLPLAALVVLFDQLTKVLAETFLTPGLSHPVLPNFFHFTLVENRGIAFGLLQGAERILFIVITVSLFVLLAVGFRSEAARRRTQWGIGLILGGAAGNWIDRIRVGAVVDFLDFRIWPVFNLADTAITVGVSLFLLDFFFTRKVTPSDVS